MATASVAPDSRVAIRQVVGVVAGTVRVADGAVPVDRGDDADLTFATDRETAAALIRVELATRDAFAAGRLRISGDLSKLLAGRSGAGGAARGLRRRPEPSGPPKRGLSQLVASAIDTDEPVAETGSAVMARRF